MNVCKIGISLTIVQMKVLQHWYESKCV